VLDEASTTLFGRLAGLRKERKDETTNLSLCVTSLDP